LRNQPLNPIDQPTPLGNIALNFNAIITIAYRDILKFLRDRARIIASFVFPFVFIGVVGSSFQGSLGTALGFNFLIFTFTGVYAQTLFQSAAFGVISLIEDRDTDFAQEIFVSPVSRYAIVFGKILGEALVAMAQGVGIIAFMIITATASGIPVSLGQILILIPVGIIVCLMGGAFGILILSNLRSRRAAEQIFPFVMLPQYFLAGVFNPLTNLPPLVAFASYISPLRYAVDLTRGAYYLGTPEYPHTVLASPLINSAIMVGMFVVFLFIGTVLFIRAERNR
jgi:ABC-2 type transport system permease protein